MQTLPKTKHVDAVKLEILNNQQLVQAVLNWEEQQYCDFQFEAGISYGKRITDGDTMGYDMLIRSRYFWQWWKNEWSKRDADFLDYYSSTANKSALHDQYMFQHNAHRLQGDELMDKMACSMIGTCIKEFHKKSKKELVR